jgi:RNA polymerase primary sigma factor
MNGTQVGGGSGLSLLLARIREKPLLSRGQERDLAERVGEDRKEGLDELIESNLGFVIKIAKEYRDTGIPFEDLVSEGCVGLIEAARRYDPSRDCKFVTYAMWWIRKGILSAVVRQSGVVRVPTYHREQVRKVRGAEEQLQRTLGRSPRPDELTARLSMSTERINRILQWKFRAFALDDRVGANGDKPVHELIADDGAASPEEDLIRSQNRDIVREALSELTHQERTVLSHRFGLDDGPMLTLNEIGRILGLSRERVRQIETQGKKRLRKIVIRKRHPAGRNGRERVVGQVHRLARTAAVAVS